MLLHVQALYIPQLMVFLCHPIPRYTVIWSPLGHSS